jgi:hypothetical protein
MTTFDVTDPLILFPLLGGFVGMAVGLVTIWSQVKSTRSKAKADVDASNLASENRLKEFFDLKFSIFDVKMENLKDDIKIQDATYTRKLEDRSRFFMDLLDKLEKKFLGDNKE